MLIVLALAALVKIVLAKYKAGKINKGVAKNPKTRPDMVAIALSGGTSCRHLIDFGWDLTT